MKKYINEIGSRVIKEGDYYKYQIGPVIEEPEGLRIMKDLNQKGYQVLMIRYTKEKKEILKFLD